MTWYAIRTAPQREIAINLVLQRKGYSTYLPWSVKESRSRRPDSTPVTFPLFPGYIFVEWPFAWSHLLTERHVLAAVSVTNDNRPSPISDACILAMMDASARAFVKKAKRKRELGIGDAVIIPSGVLPVKTTEIIGLSKSKAKMMLQLFNREVVATISIQDLEAA